MIGKMERVQSFLVGDALIEHQSVVVFAETGPGMFVSVVSCVQNGLIVERSGLTKMLCGAETVRLGTSTKQ